MTAYTRTRVGPPEGGRYLVGDVVTDGANTKWKCVRGGMADGNGSDPQHALFVAIPNGAQPAPAAKTTSTTLTAAELLGGLITANQGAGATATYTLPTPASMDAALPNMQVDESFEFTLINISTNAAETCSIAANGAFTVVGDVLLAANATGDESARTFRVRKTGASTYVAYPV